MKQKVWIWLALGGAIGSLLRYGVSVIIPDTGGFPYPTMTVNLIGCFLLPFIINGNWLTPHLRKIVGTGVIGSFTTFSTFSVESIHLITSGHLRFFLTYTGISIFAGICLSAFGFWISSHWNEKQVE
ncbi:MAG: CrcB family protein [Bacillaceae bacterium]|nr:CrcB family protein [Bacillaceae bacterium]